MKTFTGEIERTDEYIIEIDDQVWNESALKDWNNVFGGCEDLEALAQHINSF